jgi:hypothetical protein
MIMVIAMQVKMKIMMMISQITKIISKMTKIMTMKNMMMKNTMMKITMMRTTKMTTTTGVVEEEEAVMETSKETAKEDLVPEVAEEGHVRVHNPVATPLHVVEDAVRLLDREEVTRRGVTLQKGALPL